MTGRCDLPRSRACSLISILPSIGQENDAGKIRQVTTNGFAGYKHMELSCSPFLDKGVENGSRGWGSFHDRRPFNAL